MSKHKLLISAIHVDVGQYYQGVHEAVKSVHDSVKVCTKTTTTAGIN